MSTKLVRLSTDEDKKYLLPLGDMHWGHPNCDQESVKGYLKWARKHNAWILLMGDLIENSTRDSVGAGVYEQILQPDQQKIEIINLLQPYTDLIVGSLTGNHEERTYKASGMDPAKEIAGILGVPYMRYGGFIRAVVNGKGFTVYASHGASGAGTSTGKLNAVKKLAQIADADLYLMGHVHDLLTETVVRKTIDTRTKAIISRRQHFVVTGNFLTYEDSYSEMKCYIPSKIGAPRIRFAEDIHVSI
jgi:predicted phosphodiesterase